MRRVGGAVLTFTQLLVGTVVVFAALYFGVVGAYWLIDKYDVLDGIGLDGSWACGEFATIAEANEKLEHERRHDDQGSIRKLDPDGDGEACDGWVADKDLAELVPKDSPRAVDGSTANEADSWGGAAGFGDEAEPEEEQEVAEVPDVTGLAGDEAADSIEANGDLTASYEEEPTDPAACTVEDQDEYGEVDPGTEVFLTLDCPPEPTYAPSGVDGTYNCDDFDYQSDAQEYYDYVGDEDGLDHDYDGVPCESLP